MTLIIFFDPNSAILIPRGPSGGVFSGPKHMFRALLTAPIFCIYLQTAPGGKLSYTVHLLCLPETTVRSWGRYRGKWKIGVAAQKRHPPTAGAKLGESLNLGLNRIGEGEGP
jgi:hypothetical protein